MFGYRKYDVVYKRTYESKNRTETTQPDNTPVALPPSGAGSIIELLGQYVISGVQEIRNQPTAHNHHRRLMQKRFCFVLIKQKKSGK